MKVLYLDCSMGAAGDMMASALAHLLTQPDDIVDKINKLGIPGAKVTMEASEKSGISGMHMQVSIDGQIEHEQMHHTNSSIHPHKTHTHENAHEMHSHEAHPYTHTHSRLADLDRQIDMLAVSDSVKSQAKAIYKQIAKAEAKVHGKPIEEIHFHEVGTMDALCDIVAVCLLMEELNPDRVIASPICTGFGHVHCAHGMLPIPAPATAELLKGLPIYAGDIEGELCTPTGAALIHYFVDSFQQMPPMSVEKIGYGMGTKDFPKVNCIRALLGDMDDAPSDVVELSCNIDDMTGEEIAFATEKLMQGVALDVYTTAIGMKKSRPGILLQALCKPEDKEALVKDMFYYTSTIGIREYHCSRYVLNRSEQEIDTPFGRMRKKISAGYGITKEKIEAEDLKAAADKML